MPSSLVKELELKEARNTFVTFKKKYEWDNADLAAALRVDRRTVQRYNSGDSYPARRVRNQIADLREISILLSEIFDDREEALRWLNSSVSVLKGRRPMDLIQ
jgi:ribosome-binding protein aMBF1 (putative translation factor)